MGMQYNRSLATSVCVLFFCLTGAAVFGQEHLLKENNGRLYRIEGNCVPRRTTYGFYQTHWRQWPYAQPPKVPTLRKKAPREPEGSTAFPDAEIPRENDEASLNPDLPGKPEERTKDVVPVPGNTQLRSDRKLNPFEDDRSRPGVNDSPTSEPESTYDSDLDDLNDLSPTGSIRLDRAGLTDIGLPRGKGGRPLAGNPIYGHNNPLRRHTSMQPPRDVQPSFTPTAQNVSHVRTTRYVPVQEIPTALNPLR